MRVSVLIIAHNEEHRITKCIESLLGQSQKADEIVLISHNSTDATSALTQHYPVRTIEYNGPAGSAYARIRGFEEVTGDIVLCIDGDAVAAPNWIAVMSTKLSQPNMVMVGSWIKISGALYARLGSWRWYFFCNTKGSEAINWLWGASIGLWVRDRERIIDALRQGLCLSEELKLPHNPDDYWLALFMSTYGNLEVTNTTWVEAQVKETRFFEWLRRQKDCVAAWRIIRTFVNQGGLPGVSLHR